MLRSASPPAVRRSDCCVDEAGPAQQACEPAGAPMRHGTGPKSRRCQHGFKQPNSFRQPDKAAQRMDAVCCMCQQWPGDQPCPISCCCAPPVGDMHGVSLEPLVAYGRECQFAKHMRQPAVLSQPSNHDSAQKRRPRESAAKHHGLCSTSSAPDEAQHAQQLQDRPEQQGTVVSYGAEFSRPSSEHMQGDALTESSHARLLSQIDAFMQSLQEPLHVHEPAQPRQQQSSQHGRGQIGKKETEPDEMPADATSGLLVGVSGDDVKACMEASQSPLRLGSLEATLQGAKHAALGAGHRCREALSPNGPDPPALSDLIEGAVPSTSAHQSGRERAFAGSMPTARRLSSLEHVSQASLDELEALLAEQQRKVCYACKGRGCSI